MARYLPEHVTQEDGSICQWTNCWAAVGAWAVRGLTKGVRSPMPTWFRRKAKAQGCRAGSLGDIVRGLMNMGLWKYRQARYIEDMTQERLRRRLKTRTGVLVLLETDFEVWPDGKSCQPGFTDRDDAYHMVGAVCGADKQGRVMTMDPLCKRYRWTKIEDVIRAAVRYNDEHAHEKRGTVDVVLVFPPKI